MSKKAVELLINLKTLGAKELEKLAKTMRGVSKEVESSGDEFKKTGRTADELEDIIKRLDGVYYDLNGRLRDSKGNFAKTDTEAAKLAKSLTDQERAAIRARGGLGKYNRETKDAQVSTDKLKRSVKGLRGGLAGLAAVGATAVGSFAAMKGISERAEELKKMANAAERLGVSMEDFSAAEGAVFQATGRDWESLKDGLDDLNEKIIDYAKNGAGEAVDLFAQFEDLDPFELMEMDGLEQLDTVVAAMEGMSKQERSQLLDQLGSDNLRELTNILDGSNSKFMQMREEIIASGQALDEFDVDRITSMNQDLNAVRRNFQLIKDESISQIAPFLEAMSESMTENAKKAKEAGEQTGQWSFYLAVAVDVADKFYALINVIAAGALAVGANLADWGTKLPLGLLKTASGLSDKFNKGVRGLLGMDTDVETFAGKVNKAVTGFSDNIKNSAGGSIINFQRNWRELAKEPPMTKRVITKLNGVEDEAKKEGEKASDAIEKAVKDTDTEIKFTAEAKEVMRVVEDIGKKMRETIRENYQDQAIDAINHEYDVRLKTLKREELEGKKSAQEVIKERLKLETELAEKVRDAKLSVIEDELAAFKAQKEEQLAKLDEQKEGSKEYAETQRQLKETEASINQLYIDRIGLIDSTKRQAEILKFDAGNELVSLSNDDQGSSSGSDSDEDPVREAQERADLIKDAEQDIADAKIELMRLAGRENQAELAKIQQDYDEMVATLTEAGKDTSIADKLFGIKTANVELDTLRQKLDNLSAAYSYGEIDERQYQAGVNRLAPELSDAAGATGNAEAQLAVQRQIQDAQDEIQDAYREAAEEQKELDRQVNDVKLQLWRKTGREFDAEMSSIEGRYADLLAQLGADSEQAEIVKKLIGVEKANAELDKLMQKLDELKRQYSAGEITTGAYNEAVNNLSPEIRDAANRTENDETIRSTDKKIGDAEDEGDMTAKIGKKLKGSVDGAADAMTAFIMGTKSAKDAFADFARSVLADITKMIMKQMILNAISAAFGGGGGGAPISGGFMTEVGSLHTGGTVGAYNTGRSVPISIFTGALRYHDGGPILKPGEVPIIAQQGEYMLDKYDIRNPRNGGKGKAGSGGGSNQAVNISNMLDNKSVASVNETPEGRSSILNVIRAESGTIRSILGR